MTFMTMALRELRVSMTELLRCDELGEAGRRVKERKNETYHWPSVGRAFFSRGALGWYLQLDGILRRKHTNIVSQPHVSNVPNKNGDIRRPTIIV